MLDNAHCAILDTRDVSGVCFSPVFKRAVTLLTDVVIFFYFKISACLEGITYCTDLPQPTRQSDVLHESKPVHVDSALVSSN
jgi:hypothetical protein